MSKLYLIGTPIGNMEDMSPRALRLLKESDVIFTEDKRVTLKLINKLEIGQKELFTFNQTNAERVLDRAFELIVKNNTCSLVSDAGMPVISDPGSHLVKKCRENNIEIDVIPGPSAPLTALAASGFPGSKFLFHGFIPRDKNRRRMFRDIVDLPYLHIFFDSPNRILKTLKDIKNIMGNREIFLAREMTKIHQEFFRGTVDEAIAFFESKDSIKGEFTVVLSGKNP